MLGIENRIFVTIKLDNNDIGDLPSGFNSVTLTEGNLMRIPTFKLELADRTSLLVGQKALTDANQFEITVSKSMSDNQCIPRKYRLFRPDGSNAMQGPGVALVGYADYPKYLTEAVSESIKGSSDDVFRAIASRCGLTYSGPKEFNGRSMADTQVWLHAVNSRATYLLDVARHAWMDENSCMALGVTSDGELRFRNIVDVINIDREHIRYVFSHNALISDADSNLQLYEVREAKERSIAGITNNYVNYGSTRTEPKLDGTIDKHKTVDVKTKGGFLAINSQMKDALSRVRVDVSTVDCGNTHAHYQQAAHQNVKLSALFSERLSVLVFDVTEVKLFDPVFYRQADADPTKPVKSSDVYIVVGKTVRIVGAAIYAERIELARMSLTMRGSADLVGPNASIAESSMLPDVKITKQFTNTTAESLTKAKALSALLQPVKDAAALLAGGRDTVLGDLSSLTSKVASLSSAIQSGIRTELDAAFKALAPTVNASVKAMQEQVALGTKSESAITRIISTAGTKAITSAANKQMVMLGHGGASDLVSRHLMASTPYKKAMALIGQSVKRVPKSATSLGSVIDVQRKMTTFNSISAQLDSSISRQWNTIVGYMGNKKAPATIVTSPAAKANGRTLSIAACTPSVTDQSFMNLVRNKIREANNTETPVWCTPEALTPKTGASMNEAQTSFASALERVQNNGD